MTSLEEKLAVLKELSSARMNLKKRLVRVLAIDVKGDEQKNMRKALLIMSIFMREVEISTHEFIVRSQPINPGFKPGGVMLSMTSDGEDIIRKIDIPKTYDGFLNRMIKP